jgi:alkanesulfonate monooxygenase SsuD/methylene tetrahydromethanopterin reductase-like flavin-dependent oxidoreductase (luciferase family)
MHGWLTGAYSPGHLSPGLWNHPRNKTYNYKKLSFWTDLAQILDKAGFHALFLADVLGCYDGESARLWRLGKLAPFLPYMWRTS